MDNDAVEIARIKKLNSRLVDDFNALNLEGANLDGKIRALKTKVEGLTREQVGLALDAARYRWAKENISDDYALGYGNPCYLLSDDSSGWDATIDAAMKGETK
jgi:hypothetical protein